MKKIKDFILKNWIWFYIYITLLLIVIFTNQDGIEALSAISILIITYKNIKDYYDKK